MTNSTNYGMKKPQGNDGYDVEHMNYNTDIIDTQLKANDQAIKQVSEQVTSIDVTTDVEEVVNRRVNSDRAKPLNTIVSDFKDVIVAAINAVRDNIKSHVTSEHTNTKNSVNTAIVGARDSINTNVDQCETNLAAKIESLKQYVSSKKSGLAGAITDKGITTSANATFDTMIANIKTIPSGKVLYSEEHSIDAYSNEDLKYFSIEITPKFLENDLGTGLIRISCNAGFPHGITGPALYEYISSSTYETIYSYNDSGANKTPIVFSPYILGVGTNRARKKPIMYRYKFQTYAANPASFKVSIKVEFIPLIGIV